MAVKNNIVAYFSMEIALQSDIPTYSGGLGVLAGDTIRSASDMELPFIATTLLYRKGYFKQELNNFGEQREIPYEWEVKNFLTELPEKVSVQIEGRIVHIKAWKYEVKGVTGYSVPVYLLDTDIPENSEYDRTLTHYLYGGDDYYRLCQEIVLGIGGVRMLRKLGYVTIKKFHMNEGHSSLLTLELIEEKMRYSGKSSISYAELEEIKSQCVFTTHTPVPAGHDQFSLDLVNRVFGNKDIFCIGDMFCFNDKLNMTYLAFNLSHYINGVALRHGEVSSHLFAPYKINAITNGIHVKTWASNEMRFLYDKYIPGWKEDNFSLRYFLSVPKSEVEEAHQSAKAKLIHHINSNFNENLNINIFTIGFARRSTKYKRADLIFYDTDRLKHITNNTGKMQIIFSGKAHPRDHEGKEIIKKIFKLKEELKNDIKIVYIENYDMEFAKKILSGVDLWLNNPIPPLEASGTSGMKAAINGVPSLSILDGWWVEGHIEGVTGWSIGEDRGALMPEDDRYKEDAYFLYDKLEKTILPLYYNNHDKYLDVMIKTVAFNGSFFNTHRMLDEYVYEAYGINQ